MLPDKAIKEYQKLYKEEFGIKLTDEEAVKKANDLIGLFKVFSRPKSSNHKPGVPSVVLTKKNS